MKETNLRKNMQAVTLQYAMSRVEEMLEEYKKTQDVFNEGANPFLDGVVFGMEKVIKTFEQELKEVRK